MTTEPLIIGDWDLGIGDSPLKGFELIRNASLRSSQGSISPNYETIQEHATASSSTFTAVAATDVCTVGGAFTALTTGVAVTLTTTGTLPAGLSLSTTYFIILVSGSTYKLATTYANSQSSTAIDITDTGTGTHTMATINIGTVNSIARDYLNSVTFILDSNARAWAYENGELYLMPGNTLTSGVGKGLVHFINSDATGRFLFVFRNNAIDVMNVTTAARRKDPVGTSSWTNGWQTMNTTAGTENSHHAIVGQDNKIYFCDARYVGRITEATTFDPASGATYTYTNNALDLPQGELAEWLDELGVNLLIAGKTYRYIYPWDRVSDSFFLPIRCAENGVYRIKNINNTVFILNGLTGNIYSTQGSVVRLLKQIPENIMGGGSANLVTWGGVSEKQGSLLFGVGMTNNSANSGLYMVSESGVLVQENTPSTGATNVTAVISQAGGEFYDLGYASGFDTTDTNRYASFETVARSALFQVATKTEQGSFNTLEVQMNRPASSGSVRVSYRENLGSTAFTTIATFTMDGATTSFTYDAGLTDLEKIQVQVEMSGTGSTNNLVDLYQVRLLP